jgi:hypothetical protein
LPIFSTPEAVAASFSKSPIVIRGTGEGERSGAGGGGGAAAAACRPAPKKDANGFESLEAAAVPRPDPLTALGRGGSEGGERVVDGDEVVGDGGGKGKVDENSNGVKLGKVDVG